MKNCLIFASTNIKPYTRLETQLKSINIFDNVIALSELDLDLQFRQLLTNRITKYGIRGYAYWSWKPYIILKQLDALNCGDILIYSDSGSSITNDDKTLVNFNTIFNVLKDENLISFKTSSNDISYTTKELRLAVENMLSYKFTLDELYENQYSATTLFIKKSIQTIKIVQQWNDICQNNFETITDLFNDTQLSEFKDNRHDQSVLSLLLKYYKIPILKQIRNPFMHTRIK